jgi:hypothetical protein
MELFERFVSSSLPEKQPQIEDAMVLPQTIGSIPRSTHTQNIMIDSQFKSLEDFINNYDVSKMCLETSGMFKKLIGDFKQRMKDHETFNL